MISVEIDTADGDHLEFRVNRTETELVDQMNDTGNVLKFPLHNGTTYVFKNQIVSIYVQNIQGR